MIDKLTKSELLEVIAFMRPRATMANRCRFDDPERDTGVSSNALLESAFCGVEPAQNCYPADGDDLTACYRMYEKAPSKLQERMTPILRKYEAHVVKRGEMG